MCPLYDDVAAKMLDFRRLAARFQSFGDKRTNKESLNPTYKTIIVSNKRFVN